MGIRSALFLTSSTAMPTAKSNHPGRESIRCGAGDGIRTRDPELGRLALYQLSYSRSRRLIQFGGEGRIRTSEGISRQIYSLLPLAAREPLHFIHSAIGPSRWRESNSQPTAYKAVALPLSYIGAGDKAFLLFCPKGQVKNSCATECGRASLSRSVNFGPSLIFSPPDDLEQRHRRGH